MAHGRVSLSAGLLPHQGLPCCADSDCRRGEHTEGLPQATHPHIALVLAGTLDRGQTCQARKERFEEDLVKWKKPGLARDNSEHLFKCSHWEDMDPGAVPAHCVASLHPRRPPSRPRLYTTLAGCLKGPKPPGSLPVSLATAAPHLSHLQHPFWAQACFPPQCCWGYRGLGWFSP